ncbi:hypothetical protein KIW84_040632 [Lathyrus oleraceus]|uniref:DUF7745 domain-containing protein n=1 Tax=Pisum sativum TaxID=3888 RepID=A0A9D4X7S6_PEA|nr:hypothetical protein KIW84_040632 [Pisum sativum]
MFRKVTRAWEKVHVKENKLKRKDISSEESYTLWVKERVHLVKLPFVIDPTYIPDIPDPIPVSIDEVDRVRKLLLGLNKIKKDWSIVFMTRPTKRIRIEAEKILPHDWRRTYQELLNLRDQVHLQVQDHKVLTTQVTQLEGEVQYLRDLIIVAQVIVQEQGDRGEAWRIEHYNLAEFANKLVRDVPMMYMRDDNVANFHNTPQEVLEFIRRCDVMLKEFSAHLKVAMEVPL